MSLDTTQNEIENLNEEISNDSNISYLKKLLIYFYNPWKIWTMSIILSEIIVYLLKMLICLHGLITYQTTP